MDLCTIINLVIKKGKAMELYGPPEEKMTIREFEDRPIDITVLEKIVSEVSKTQMNGSFEDCKFIFVNDKKEKTEILDLKDKLKSSKQEETSDVSNSVDSKHNELQQITAPKEFSMLYKSACLVLPFFKLKEAKEPSCVNSLTEFASIWLCVENLLTEAKKEGITGLTRIPSPEEVENIKKIINNHPKGYVLPCYVALGYPKKD